MPYIVKLQGAIRADLATIVEGKMSKNIFYRIWVAVYRARLAQLREYAAKAAQADAGP